MDVCRLNGRDVELISKLNEHSSDGKIQKWIVRDISSNNIYYLKSASKISKGRYGYECETECIASRLALMLGAKATLYDIGIFEVHGKSIKVCLSVDYSTEMETV